MGKSERQPLNFFTDLDGNTVFEDDWVAAAAGNYGGLRIGRVLEITGVYKGDGQGFKCIRVKVQIEKATGLTGQKYNKETERWEPKPYTMTYDGESVVKLRG